MRAPLHLLLAAAVLGCDPAAEQPSDPSGADAGAPADSGDADDPGADDPLVSPTGYESALVCAECHERQYEEWRQSMHAYASRSPVFDLFANKAYRDSSGEVGTFCTGCHSQVGTAEGEDGATTAAERSDISLEGITCDFCHTAVGHDGAIGNANIETIPGEVKYGPYQDAEDAIEHEGRYGEFITTPEFCGSCHDVFAFPGIQLEEAYTEYIVSPAAEEGVRCQDCHMGPEPGAVAERPRGPSAVVDGVPYGDREMASHRFIGPDYSLLDDFPYPDDLERSAEAQSEYLEQAQVLMENAARLVDVAATHEQDINLEEPVDIYDWYATDWRTTTADALVITADLESLNPGHGLPTGFTSERQVWVHVEVRDGRTGDIVWASGDLDSYEDLRDGHSWDVQSHAVEWDWQLVNLQSKNVLVQRYYNADGTFNYDGDKYGEGGVGATVETVFPMDANYIEKHNLMPLEIRQLSWFITGLPPAPYEVDVSLKYRNLPPYVFRALQADDLVPRLNTYVIDSHTVVSE